MRILAAFAPVFALACGQAEGIDLMPRKVETRLSLVFDTVDARAIARQPIGPVSLRVINQDGALVVSPAVEVKLAAQREGDTFAVELDWATSSDGRVDFPAIALPIAGTIRLLATSDDAAPATSDPILVTPPIAGLSFFTQPGDTVAGDPITPAVEVELVDADGARAIVDGVEIEIEWLEYGLPTMDPSAKATTSEGVARFEDLRGARVGDGYALAAHANSFGSKRSRVFSLVPPPATWLRWVVPPSRSAVRDQPMAPFSVELVDRTGQRASSSEAELIVEVVSGSVPLRGTTAVRTTAGVAEFSGLSYPVAEQIRLACSSPGLGELASEPIFVREPPEEPIRAGGETAAEPFSAYSPSLSFDGRRLAFVCGACLTPSGESVSSPRLIDFDLGTNRALDTTPSGAPADNWDLEPHLTRDGTKVAFYSGSTNYLVNDANGFDGDAFLRDLIGGGVDLIGVDPLGVQFERGSSVRPCGVSDDGNLVAFAADGPMPAWNGVFNAVYVRDRAPGTTRLIADVGWSAAYSNTTSALSADGSMLLFDAPADGLTPGDQNGVPDVFVAELATGSVRRISNPLPNLPGDGGSSWAQWSADARFVVFQSDGENLVLGDTNRVADIFVSDLSMGTIERVSVSSSGTQASDSESFEPNHHLVGSAFPVISDDGRFVAFLSAADNLVDDDTNGAADVFLHDRLSKQTLRVNVSVDGVQGDRAATQLAISGDGRTIAFSTYATNVVRGDSNANVDIYVVPNPFR